MKLLCMLINMYATYSFRVGIKKIIHPKTVLSLARSNSSPASRPLNRAPTSSNTNTNTNIDENTVSNNQVMPFLPGAPIDVVVTRLGYLGASVDIASLGMTGLILKDELYFYSAKNDNRPIEIGDELRGYAQSLTEEGKVNVALRQGIKGRMIENRQLVMKLLLESETGQLPLGDKSSSEAIADLLLGMSKKDYKTAIGSLYRDRLIITQDLSIKLSETKDKIVQKWNTLSQKDSTVLSTYQTKLSDSVGKLVTPIPKKSLSDPTTTSTTTTTTTMATNEALNLAPKILKKVQKKTLLLGNLPLNADGEDLYAYFEELFDGSQQILNLDIIKNDKGISIGRALLTLRNIEFVNEAINLLKEYPYRNTVLSYEIQETPQESEYGEERQKGRNQRVLGSRRTLTPQNLLSSSPTTSTTATPTTTRQLLGDTDNIGKRNINTNTDDDDDDGDFSLEDFLDDTDHNVKSHKDNHGNTRSSSSSSSLHSRNQQLLQSAADTNVPTSSRPSSTINDNDSRRRVSSSNRGDVRPPSSTSTTTTTTTTTRSNSSERPSRRPSSSSSPPTRRPKSEWDDDFGSSSASSPPRRSMNRPPPPSSSSSSYNENSRSSRPPRTIGDDRDRNHHNSDNGNGSSGSSGGSGRGSGRGRDDGYNGRFSNR